MQPYRGDILKTVRKLARFRGESHSLYGQDPQELSTNYRIFYMRLLTIVVFLNLVEIMWMPPVSSFINSRRLSILLLFVCLVLTCFSEKRRIELVKILPHRISFSVLFFFFILLISTVNSSYPINRSLVISSLMSLVGFFLGVVEAKKSVIEKLVIKSIVATSIFLGVLSLIMWLNPGLAIIFIPRFFSQERWEYLVYDYGRGRIFPLGLLAVASPSLVWWMFKAGKNFTRHLLVTFFVILAVFLTNYRSHIITAVIGLFWIIAILPPTREKKLVRNLFLGYAVISLIITVFFMPTNLLTRINLTSPEEKQAIYSRLRLIGNTISIFSAYPFLGIGLGNYITYNDPQVIDIPSSQWNKNLSGILLMNSDPHNSTLLIAAESGALGLAVYLSMLGMFAYSDLEFFKKFSSETSVKVIMILSWIFILGSNLDSFPRSGQIYYFLLRGIVLGSQLRKRFQE